MTTNEALTAHAGRMTEEWHAGAQDYYGQSLYHYLGLGPSEVTAWVRDAELPEGWTPPNRPKNAPWSWSDPRFLLEDKPHRCPSCYRVGRRLLRITFRRRPLFALHWCRYCRYAWGGYLPWGWRSNV